MKHQIVTALAITLFATNLSACGASDLPLAKSVSTPAPTPTLTMTSTPTSTPTLTPALVDSATPTLIYEPVAKQTPTLFAAAAGEDAFNLAEKCTHQWESTQKPDDLDCALHYYQEAIDLVEEDKKPYCQFRFDRLLWLSEQGGEKPRDRILDYIRAHKNEEAVDFLFDELLPEPQPVDIGTSLKIYKDEWGSPHFTIAQYGARLNVSETHVPGSIYEGHSSLQISWDKHNNTWASLVVGFDPRIADEGRARAGEMLSLKLDRLSAENYHLEFAVRSSSEVDLWEEPIMRIKLQDQNLIISESIGNQIVCHIQLTEEWTNYSIALAEFVPDQWILDQYAGGTQQESGEPTWLAFDWTRIKQINFDVPYFASGNGTLWLDDVKLVRADLADSGANGCVER